MHSKIIAFPKKVITNKLLGELKEYCDSYLEHSYIIITMDKDDNSVIYYSASNPDHDYKYFLCQLCRAIHFIEDNYIKDISHKNTERLQDLINKYNNEFDIILILVNKEDEIFIDYSPNTEITRLLGSLCSNIHALIEDKDEIH